MCSDRQITNPSGFKYEENKIFSSVGSDYAFLLSYAGFPDAADVMFHKVKDSIPQILTLKNGFPADRAQTVLEKTFKNSQAKHIWTLIAMRIDNCVPFLLKTSGSTVVQAHTEHIGAGDSSALRYLSEFLIPPYELPTVSEAQILGNYMVFVANRYVDGCSGGPDWATIHGDGHISHGKGAIVPNMKERFSYCEAEIGRTLRELLFSAGIRKALTQSS